MICWQTKAVLCKNLDGGDYRSSLYCFSHIGWMPIILREDIMVTTEYAEYRSIFGVMRTRPLWFYRLKMRIFG